MPRFRLYRADLDFILEQIEIAEANAAGAPLQSLVPNWDFPFGLRTLSGANNNLLPFSAQFGAADNVFPRLTTPIFRTAETQPADFFGPGSVTDCDRPVRMQRRFRRRGDPDRAHQCADADRLILHATGL